MALPKDKNFIKSHLDFINCFGLSLKYLGLTTVDFWVDTEDMKTFIGDHFKEVKKPESGDMVVLFKNNNPIHSGVILTDGTYIHKEGKGPTFISSFESFIKSYSYMSNPTVLYFRPKTKKSVLDKYYKPVYDLVRNPNRDRVTHFEFKIFIKNPYQPISKIFKDLKLNIVE